MNRASETLATPGSGKPGAVSWPKVVMGLLALAVFVTVGIVGYRTLSAKDVTIVVAGEGEFTLTTRQARVESILQEAGIPLREGDEVRPDLQGTIGADARIEVIPAQRVTVLVDGNAVPVAVAEGTVRDALVRADVVMGPMDRVVPVRSTPLQEGMEIQVIRVTQEVVEEIEMIPFRTVEWAEPQLPKGTTRIVREGQEGILKKEFRLTYENGQLAHREELGHTVVQEALSRIVGVGTRNDANVIETASGTFRYVDVIEVEATAYYPGPRSTGEWADGYTYTGLVAGYGVVAVDPTIIPLGTRLYIPGYGEAIAADIGGAIKGHRIDLGFATYEEAIQYGRQRGVRVYILAD